MVNETLRRTINLFDMDSLATLVEIWENLVEDMGNRWGNSGNSVRLYYLGSKITADGDCSHEIKRRFLLRRKVMTNLESILKSRDIFPTKVHLVKAAVFQRSCMDVRAGL